MKLFIITYCIFFLFACQTKSSKEIIHTAEEAELLDKIQLQSFNYFWEAGEPNSGAARERVHMDDIYPSHDKNIVTSGGTGFGIMSTIVAVERGFISRQQAYDRLLKLTNWLESADRFHGAWPHWFTGETGKVKPFSKFDDGADLVETAFLAQGLITARQYFRNGNKAEKDLAKQMDTLWKGIEWNFFTQGQDVLYWHWSPEHEFKMNFAVRGFNECLIMYVLAAASPEHSIDSDVYLKGFMKSGKVATNASFYDIPTIVDHYDSNNMLVGPLFWSHYSFLGLDPNELKDPYVDYQLATENHARIHHAHSVANPNNYKGYSEKCWGLTSSYSMSGYAGHNPEQDLGVISPTAALSSFPYTPEESMDFLKYLYQEKPELVGEYGPYDAFSLHENWSLPRYLAIDQLPIPVMIENYRSGLLWDLFMSAPEIHKGLDKLGFEYKKRAAI